MIKAAKQLNETPTVTSQVDGGCVGRTGVSVGTDDDALVIGVIVVVVSMGIEVDASV